MKEHAARILDPMLTDAGSKRPRTVGSLAKSTGLDAHIIEGTLFRLAEAHTQAGLGLVRLITDADTAADRVWEVSHDFIATLLGPVIRTPSISRWQRLRPVFSPAAVVIWVLVCVGVFEHYRGQRDRASGQLSRMGIGVSPRDEGGYTAQSDRRVFAATSMTGAGPLLALHADVIELNLSGCGSLTSVEGLQGPPALKSLDLSGCDSLTSLEELRPLKSLVALDITDLSLQQLKGLEKLTQLRSLRRQDVDDLSELPPLPNLREIDLGVNPFRNLLSSLADFQPLARLPALEVVYTYRFTDEQVAKIRELLPDVMLDDSRFRKYRYPPPGDPPAEME